MIIKPSRKLAREKRHYKLRDKISGTGERPRLSVFRSNQHIYAQVIDDTKGITLAAASTKEKALAGKLAKTWDKEAARAVGEAVAKKAIDKGITTVVFDRGGYIYHGKVQALADAAREVGLQF
ncbi:MAG: 50S ribosomal protein L18 [Clostridiales bacterium]|jgi:large subunit ribosomal protein L18|nr:50S ribosomal protein L18 [Clostridiales bacterium]